MCYLHPVLRLLYRRPSTRGVRKEQSKNEGCASAQAANAPTRRCMGAQSRHGELLRSVSVGHVSWERDAGQNNVRCGVEKLCTLPYSVLKPHEVSPTGSVDGLWVLKFCVLVLLASSSLARRLPVYLPSPTEQLWKLDPSYMPAATTRPLSLNLVQGRSAISATYLDE